MKRISNTLTLLALILILLLTTTSIVLAAGAVDKNESIAEPVAPLFNDITATEPNAIYINYLAHRQIMQGFPDGGFHPQEGLTRAQAATVIVKATNLKSGQPTSIQFKDVKPDHWAAEYINSAAQAGYLKGYPDGSYHPDQQLTRAEGISLVLRLSRQKPDNTLLPQLKDVDSSHWAAAQIATGITAEMIGIASDQSFFPDNPFTRSSLARALAILLTRDPELYNQALIGILKPVTGQITLTRNGEKQIVKQEITLEPEDIIQSNTQSSAEINYPDGSAVLVKENTEITIKESQGRACIKRDGSPGTAVDWLNIDMKQGTIFTALATLHRSELEEEKSTANSREKLYASLGNINLAAQKQEKSPWYQTAQQKKVKVKVDMPWGVAAVRGTFISIRVEPDGRANVSCLTGDAEVSSLNLSGQAGGTVALQGGQSSSLNSVNAAPEPVTVISPEAKQEFTREKEWIEGTARNMDQNQEIPDLAPALAEQQQAQPQQQTVQQPPQTKQLEPVQSQSTLDTVQNALSGNSEQQNSNPNNTNTNPNSGNTSGTSVTPGTPTGAESSGGGSSGGSNSESSGISDDSSPRIQSIASISGSVIKGQSYTPPATITAIMSNTTSRQVAASWENNNPDTSNAGIISINGTVVGYSGTVTLTLTVEPPPAPIARIDDLSVSVVEGDPYEMPPTVTAILSDGNTRQISVDWDNSNIDTTQAGVVTVNGSAEGYSGTVKLILTVERKIGEPANIVQGQPLNLSGGIRIDLGSLTVPEGATVTVNEISAPNTGSAGLEAVGKVIDISFENLDIYQPVSLSLPVNPGVDPNKAGIYYYNGSSWEYQPSQAGNGVVTALVSHFSIYGVLMDNTPPSQPSLSKGNASAEGVELNFSATDNTRVEKYEIYRNGELLATVESQNYLDTQVESGQSYTYQVKAIDKSGNQSELSEVLEAEILSDKKEITSFSLNEQTGEALIDNVNHYIEIEIKKEVDIKQLLPQITVSEGASIDPASGTARDFSSLVVYTVTATDSSIQEWTIVVKTEESNNPTLSNISICIVKDTGNTPLELNPVFNPEQQFYTSTVPQDTEQIAITATPTETGDIIKVNGQEAGQGPVIIDLDADQSSVQLEVTAEDASCQSYTIRINREAAENTPQLSSLSISPGNLNPAFSPDILNYTASVSYEVGSITVSVATADPNAGITINNGTGALGSASATIPLNEGNNTITVRVATEDGVTSKDYTVSITRDYAPVIPNHAPVANSVTITGTAYAGEELTGNYDYSDAENDLEGISTFQWYRGTLADGSDKTAIDGAASSTYTLIEADTGKYIFFEVTPVASSGTVTGSMAISPAFHVNAIDHSPPVASVTTVAINIGENVSTARSSETGIIYLVLDSADISTRDAAEAAVSAGNAEKATVSEANTDTIISTAGLQPGTYKVVAADAAGNLSLESEGIITILTPNQPPVASSVYISGTPNVGQVLTGHYEYGDAENDPAGTPIFQWYQGTQFDGSDKTAISNATGIEYTMAAGDTGKYIFFEVIPVAIEGTLNGIAVLSKAVRLTTNVSGTINSDVIWTKENSPYYVTSTITISSGKTLTIEPGTVIKFANGPSYPVGISVCGTLNAAGMADNQIYFTDYRDDEAGGDSNRDGAATTAGAGWWRGIEIQNNGVANLANCVVRYGGHRIFHDPLCYPSYWDGTYANIYKGGAGSLSLSNCTISNCGGYGVLINSSAVHNLDNNIVQNIGIHGICLNNAGSGVNITGNTISSCSNTGICLGNSSPNIQGNTITGNTNHGIYTSNGSPIIQSNTINNNGGYGLYIAGEAIPASISNNSFSNNVKGSIGGVGSGSGAVISTDNTFEGIFRIEGGSINTDTVWKNTQVYYITSTITISTGKTLTIEPGTVIKFANYLVGISVCGTLNAAGMADNQIYFTDYRDDEAGGDSNGDGAASTAGAGWWRGIEIPNNGVANLANCVVRYGGYRVYRSPLCYPSYWEGTYANIYKTGAGSLSLSNCTISNSPGYGVLIENSSAVHNLDNNIVQNIGAYGIYLYNAGNGVNVSGNTVSASSNTGICLSNSSPLLYRNNIYGNNVGINCTSGANPTIGGSTQNKNKIYNNTSYGVQNTTSTVNINAQYNWWGDASGPYQTTTNPSGAGDRVSAYVDYSNYLISPDQTVDLNPPTASVTTATINIGENVTTARSSETGIIYLVLDSADITTQEDAEAVVITGTAKKAIVTAANTDTVISTLGLAVGTYKVVAADLEGQLSFKSDGTITINIFAGGTGTEADPYIITTAQSLDRVRNDLSACYRLGADIDLGVVPYNTGEGWLPIGDMNNPFTGKFDGAGYVITNLFINRPEKDYVGLFGYINTGDINAISSGDIVNVQIENASVSGNCFVGTLAGMIELGTISNSHTDCTVNAVNSYAGGLVGLLGSDSCADPMALPGGKIIYSYSTGNINGSDNTGGLVGLCNGFIYDSYSTANVNGNGGVGALAGAAFSPIYNSYSTGTVSGASDTGGLVGWYGVWPPDVYNSYYDTNTTNQTDNTDKGIPKTTIEMKQQATFEGWDFTGIWTIGEGNDYPRLRENPNAMPTATGVTIAGTTTVGETLTGSYTYSDPDNEPEGTSTFQWYRGTLADVSDKVAIEGVTSPDYILVTADAGKYIFFEVTPVAGSGTLIGTPVLSSATISIAAAI